MRTFRSTKGQSQCSHSIIDRCVDAWYNRTGVSSEWMILLGSGTLEWLCAAIWVTTPRGTVSHYISHTTFASNSITHVSILMHCHRYTDLTLPSPYSSFPMLNSNWKALISSKSIQVGVGKKRKVDQEGDETLVNTPASTTEPMSVKL